MDEIERVCAIVEICMAMECVYKSNLIHRDLKPENILLDEKGHIIISDFGLACLVEDDDNYSKSKSSGVGTLKFMAPEILKESKYYDNKVDVYSFCVVLYFILTEGQMPKISLGDQIVGKKATIPKKINKISHKLIDLCWSLDANDRPSFTEIIDFIKNNNFKLIDGVEKNIIDFKNFSSI